MARRRDLPAVPPGPEFGRPCLVGLLRRLQAGRRGCCRRRGEAGRRGSCHGCPGRRAVRRRSRGGYGCHRSGPGRRAARRRTHPGR
ncbi:MAG TPA: hypothetical protein VIU94_04805, partial [Streptomyces sp.]